MFSKYNCMMGSSLTFVEHNDHKNVHKKIHYWSCTGLACTIQSIPSFRSPLILPNNIYWGRSQ
jgi:hypothetical protein